jgi:hypothetical protein
MVDDAPVDTEGAITSTVLDYYWGWFEGDPVRMERALHPELCKRSMKDDDDGSETIQTFTAGQMIGWTAEGRGRTLLAKTDDPRIEIEIEDIRDSMANITVRSAIYWEYLQLLRTRQGWKIVTVLWHWV